ncbi:unnamed protein product [Fusarium venenatum]|uniref:Zn(2)-C6 fungal-type domain-containing protein n=1 Tax=Fusarium venenatum TaxID=56646 RepID=A0A2L2TNL0_9HYPO|nr:uncharacterized protein FVRRES_06616 [Fusarium venenatum]CEI62180.1 unnamed protein product [Fusarium venenatum]
MKFSSIRRRSTLSNRILSTIPKASSMEESTPSSSTGRVSGQVCDRCRRRKIRCHGEENDCSPCLQANIVCVTTAKLNRNRKRKSFYEAEDSQQRRRAPSDDPQRVSATGRSAQHSATSLSPSDTIIYRPLSLQQAIPGTVRPTTPDASNQISAATEVHQPVSLNPANEPVIGHMGRLVVDDRKASMFGGSTTGVHFISQVEQQLQLLHMHNDALPSCAYGLYLHNPWGASLHTSGLQIAHIIAQLPSNTIEIVEVAIDLWTPLYPIIHKSSTVDAIGKLFSPVQSATNDVVIVYQALGLLALGLVGQTGDCCQQHNHFICASERFYVMCTTLFDRVLAQSSLQSLQGLVIIQIYLQLSGRHSTASQTSGLAIRLAQSLGLHRHSGRFRFNPLETELRRRAWWCQYSLDAFSSAYHGMPRLIRDQDVDTDLPTSVDHNLLYQTHVEFPLPGERSQVDTAISLFKLARIIGRTLEHLYTTTRRRGAIAKIKRIQADLSMWERVVFEPEIDAEFTTPVTSRPLESLFLKVAHCVATIHLHRPALSFTTAHSQFVSSLKACGQASATLVHLLNSGLGTLGTDFTINTMVPGDWRESLLVALLYPNGIHMLWQAGLTILFTRWKGYPVAIDEDENIVQSCIESLRQFHNHTDDVGDHISQCADVLDLLRQKIFSNLQTTPDLEQLQWNIWDWPMASALELANTLDTAPLDLSLDQQRWL